MGGGFFQRGTEVEIVPMEADDTHEASDIHRSAFDRAWSPAEIDALISQGNVHGFVARPGRSGAVGVGGRASRMAGFILARFAADEAEILTIAVRERHRSRGVGWRLMLAAVSAMRRAGAETLFLEVDETNHAAIALYRRLGFETVAERQSYYKHSNGARTAALVMRLDLR